MFHLWCEDIDSKYVTSYENVIQKKVRYLSKHLNNLNLRDSGTLASGVLSAFTVEEGKHRKEDGHLGDRGKSHSGQEGHDGHMGNCWV